MAEGSAGKDIPVSPIGDSLFNASLFVIETKDPSTSLRASKAHDLTYHFILPMLLKILTMKLPGKGRDGADQQRLTFAGKHATRPKTCPLQL